MAGYCAEVGGKSMAKTLLTAMRGTLLETGTGPAALVGAGLDTTAADAVAVTRGAPPSPPSTPPMTSYARFLPL